MHRAFPGRDALLCAFVVSLAGCDEQDDQEQHEAPARAEPRALEPSEPLLARSPAPPAESRCAGGTESAIGGSLRVRLFVGEGVGLDDLRGETLAAQSYLHGYGIELKAADETVERLDLGAALRGTDEELEEALTEEGISQEELARGGQRVQKLAARLVAEPLRRHLAEHAVPPRPEVHIVMLERIVARRSAIAGYLPSAAGLTFSPLLEGTSGDAASILRDSLGLTRHTPTVLLSRRELSRLRPAIRRATLAHELGHALGLPHQSARENLMSRSRRRDCVPILTANQLAALEEGLRFQLAPRPAK